ncbi:MAG: ribonuclease P protein component [Candidatus Latescibacteria bacterium]|nr:ribonuclease P protein component [Candidatus Latescibacterota bacterium]
MNNRLLKSEILRRKRDFAQILGSAKIISSPGFTLRYAQSEKRQLAFLVSHSVASKAVTRNRIKRHLRETYRTNKDKFLENYTYVFIARPDAVNLDFGKIKAQVLNLAEKVQKKALN